MKRVLYNTCIVDPWLTVAQKMKDRYDWDPVYWVGFPYDESDLKVKEKFPGVTYHPYYEAWHGKFPACIEENYINYTPSVNFLFENAVYELQALTMMNRLDYDRHSFNHMERELFYLSLIKHWLCVINMYKPDFVISGNNPHRVYDYALYIVCKHLNIPFLIFQYSLVDGRIYATKGIYSLEGKFRSDYEKILLTQKIDEKEIAVDILEKYKKTMADYSIAKPLYMTTNLKADKKNANWFFLMKRYFSRKTNVNGQKVQRSSRTIYKNKKYAIEDSHFPLRQFVWMRKKAFDYNKKMRKLYSSMTEYPQEGEKYILFPMHYQPEETTSPCGGIFVNQYLCVETLLANTPADWYIYVKEHPHQFLSQNQGQTSRISELYSHLKKNKRVKFMPFETDSYSLIKNALAVSTVTGTVGWEALVLKKPVIIFGTIWYEECNGVLKITDDCKAHEIYNFVTSYKYDEKNILAYLQSVTNNSVRAYHYRGYKELSNIEEETCSENIIIEILKTLNANKNVS